MTVIPEAKSMIEKGSEHWNAYISKVIDDELEKKDFDIRVENENFSNLDVTDYEFSSIHFVNCRFDNCVFSTCEWESTIFEKCKLNIALFLGGHAYGLSFLSCEVRESKFEDLVMGEGKFSATLFEQVDFEECHWEADVFSKCVFMSCIVIESQLEECEFVGCRFHSCNLWNDLLRSCIFDDLSLTGIDVLKPRGGCSARFPIDHDVSERVLDEERKSDGSVFYRCQFFNADLSNFDFGESDLRMTGFDHCDLRGVNFSNSSNVSSGAFSICDLASARMPAYVNFSDAIDNIRELAGSLQRMAYFCVAFCISAILSVGIDLTASKTIKVPPLGWDVPTNYYALVVGIVIVCLQIVLMIRAENIASSMSKLPSVLPEAMPLPSHLRDTFLADLAWRFSNVFEADSGFAPRSYGLLAMLLAFGVIYFEFPLTLALLLRFTLTHNQINWGASFIVALAAVSGLLAIWAAISFVRSLRGQDIWGHRKHSYN